MNLRAPLLFLVLVPGAAALFASACSDVSSGARIGVVGPDESQFPPVADLLEHRCGSLDCHGSAQRNFIVYGSTGLRLDPNDAGLVSGGKRTTNTEYDATYRSLVGLEPQVMSYVVQHGANADPDMLTFVRKARGLEDHKGGQLFQLGDAQDQCVADWLRGINDTAGDAGFRAYCAQAIAQTP
jgi:hypothetical protein